VATYSLCRNTIRLTIHDKLQTKVEKFNIEAENIYNFDEKGFLIGKCLASKRIAPIHHLKSKKLLGTMQDGSREFISLLACICADGSALSPGLIYQGESKDMLDSWLQDFDDSKHNAWFTVSKKGWTDESIGLAWLKRFNNATRHKCGARGWQLLIVDGHCSHVNMEWIDYCDKFRIILAVLPPHSTHRLQPLDVVVFSPLATAYSNALDSFLRDSLGFTYMTKRHFWRLFAAAWDKALTEANIKKSFESPGIWPVNSSKVLDILRKDLKTPDNNSNPQPKKKTPTGVRDLRRTVKTIHKKATEITEELGLLIKASEKLAIENEVLQHDNMRMKQAAIWEKTRRKRGKPMGLFEPDRPGEAQFFSPSKIATVRERLKDKEEENEQQRREKEERQQQRAIAREEKARETQERREAAQRKREAKAVELQVEQERKKKEKAAREAKKEADRLAKEEEKARKAAERATKSVEDRKVGRQDRRGRRGIEQHESATLKVNSHDHNNEEQDQNRTGFVENCLANTTVPLGSSGTEKFQNAATKNVNMEDVPRKEVTLRSGRKATQVLRYK
jgi:hypothetical protein